MSASTVTLVDPQGRVIKSTDNGDGTATLSTGGGGTSSSVKVLDAGGTNTLAVSAGGAAKVDGSAVTQPVSAASLPLPTGAATAARQALPGTAGTASAEVLSVQGIASGTALAVSAASLPLPTGAALDATLTGGTQQAKLTDGTNTANILKSDGTSAGQNSQLVAGGHLTVAFTTTTVQAVGSTDAANFAWVAVHITSQGGSSIVNFQSSNDNVNWVVSALSPSGAYVNSSSTTGIWYGTPVGRYFRLNVTGIASGTTAGTIEFFANPRSLQIVQASQLSTWTVQPGNTANSTPWLVTPAAGTTGGYSFSNITTAATTVVKSGAGTLHALVINTKGTSSTATIYDNTVGSGTKIGTVDTSGATATILFDVAFATGLTIVTAASQDITAVYK